MGVLRSFTFSLLLCGLIGNIKPPPPFNLGLTSDDKGFNISWEMIYTEEDLLNDELEYEVRYKKKEQSWESQTKKHIEEDQRNIFLPSDKLEDCAMYVAEARAGPKQSNGYSGSWSEWSLPVTWKTQCKSRLRYEIYTVMALVVLLAVGLSVGIRTKRLQKKLCCLIPSPEDFFKPLYVLHSGDFKVATLISHCMTHAVCMAFSIWWGVSQTERKRGNSRWGILTTERTSLFCEEVRRQLSAQRSVESTMSSVSSADVVTFSSDGLFLDVFCFKGSF
ncbi:UNVERIFIED_CONTAM: hypothetical protein FKN15_008452 [Acipenser sinensis]